MPFPAGPAVRYVTPSEVRDVLIENGVDPDGSTAASGDDDAIEVAIGEAADEVDGRLAGRHTVPFTTVPSLIKTVTRDIAGYLATLTFRRGDPVPPGDPVLLRYQRAQKILDGLASGDVALGPSDPAGGAIATANVYEGTMFDTDTFALGPTSGALATNRQWW
jgi:phage gp36-like protein